MIVNSSTRDGLDGDLGEVRYLLNGIDCGSRKRVNTVRDWLARFGISEHDEFFLLWSSVIATLAEAVHAMEECKTSQKLMEFACNTIFAVLYLSYDTSADFMPQFDRNARALLEICRVLKESVKR